MNFPESILEQHTAVLGKTGSGKTSTAKLLVEQVARVGQTVAGSRVCILDPIKSDWWGLTSSADGKRAGLPFHILGGPRGHVPLHSSAGRAIGELVASGELRHSIIDMADFEPGGQARFFVDFAPALMRRMRGVVYLVLEEAHLFAPKERSGVGAENMSIHWAKMLATAGRSKGIRLVLVTQRVQALHNALLGSCDTLIAHRLVAPADQEPVLKWLTGNLSKSSAEVVRTELPSLKTGAAWLVSGESRRFERVQFPRISTYDNSATPTDEDHRHEVTTAPVDQAALRAAIGEAVAEAEANDPKLLRARISELERGAKNGHVSTDPAALEQAEQRGYARGRRDAAEAIRTATVRTSEVNAKLSTLSTELASAHLQMHVALGQVEEFEAVAQKHPLSVATVTPAPRASSDAVVKHTGQFAKLRITAGSDIDRPMPRAMLTALAQHPDGLTKGQILVHTGYRSSGPVSGCFAELQRNGWTEQRMGKVFITAVGLAALGDYEPLPTGAALRAHLLNGSKLSGMEKAMLRVLFESHPAPVAKGRILEVTGYASSGPVSASFARLVALGYANQAGRGALSAARELFQP